MGSPISISFITPIVVKIKAKPREVLRHGMRELLNPSLNVLFRSCRLKYVCWNCIANCTVVFQDFRSLMEFLHCIKNYATEITTHSIMEYLRVVSAVPEVCIYAKATKICNPNCAN